MHQDIIRICRGVSFVLELVSDGIRHLFEECGVLPPGARRKLETARSSLSTVSWLGFAQTKGGWLVGMLEKNGRRAGCSTDLPGIGGGSKSTHATCKRSAMTATHAVPP